MRRGVSALLIVLGVLLPMTGVLWWLLGLHWHQAPPGPVSRAQLLSNPTVRDWMHALSEEEREVASLRRQSLEQPAVPVPPGEALDQEQAQLLRTWKSLYAEWIADGGRGQECPGYATYHAAGSP